MVADLDFEEIDDLMVQMDDTKDLTEAIAADVAKVSSAPKPKKTLKKSVPRPAKAVKSDPKPKKKVEINKPAAKNEKPADAPKVESVKKEKQKTPAPNSVEAETELDGTKVAVRVLTKYVEHPEELIYQPNPKTGRFMDMVDPKNDMTANRQQPHAVIPVAKIIKTDETIIETVEIVEEIADDATSDNSDRDRLENNGLNPDATLEEMLENAEPEESDEFLEELMNNLGDDIEDQPSVSAANKNDDASDILSFQDRSDAFLSEFDIEKRPLGGGATAVAAAMNDDTELKADKEFIEDKPNDKWLDGKNKHQKTQNKLEKSAEKRLSGNLVANAKPQKTKRTGQALLYVALILLLAILGGSLGAVAYFSGLF